MASAPAPTAWPRSIARFCGSITFVWIHVVLFAAWIGYNALPWFQQFDPYPVHLPHAGACRWRRSSCPPSS